MKSVNKSTSPVIFLSANDMAPPCNDLCTSTYMYGVQDADSLHGIALQRAEVAASTASMQSTRQQTALPEQTGTISGASEIQPEKENSSENKLGPLGTALPTDNIGKTDAAVGARGLHIGSKEKTEEKKHGQLACGQSRLHDEPSSSPFIRQELLPVQEEVTSCSSVSSSLHANSIERTSKTPSLSSVSTKHTYTHARAQTHTRTYAHIYIALVCWLHRMKFMFKNSCDTLPRS
jgi:hypothetical protein